MNTDTRSCSRGREGDDDVADNMVAPVSGRSKAREGGLLRAWKKKESGPGRVKGKRGWRRRNSRIKKDLRILKIEINQTELK